MKQRKITVLAEGAWGTAIALILADKGYEVALWCHDSGMAKTISSHRVNTRYLPGVRIPENIFPTASLKEALYKSEWVFEAVPVQHMRTVFEQAVPHITQEHKLVLLSKGIEENTSYFPIQIADDIFGATLPKVVVAGPSFAAELARKQMTGLMVGAYDMQFAQDVACLLEHTYVRTFLSVDPMGMHIGGAYKNLVALGVGMLRGAGYGDNACTLFLMRGLEEMLVIAQLFGCRSQTIYSYSGIGDLVLTSMGESSKNLQVGKRLGAGDSLENILSETGFIPEGINTLRALMKFQDRYACSLPLSQMLHDIVFADANIKDVLLL